MNKIYKKQVELLIRCLPIIEKQTCFALKGGTAINLFVRDMPRLSIDIDLVYLPIESRAETLSNIEATLKEIAQAIEHQLPFASVGTLSNEGHVNKLIVNHNGARIKIEPNIVQRGAVFTIDEKVLCERAEIEFEASATANTVAVPELYGSKITAALDRQHPRDLFDVKLLLENEGLTNDIRKAFVIYLACHPRPMNELLNPNRKDISGDFKNQFEGMTTIPITLADLHDTREQLIQLITKNLSSKERQFLMSIKKMKPDYSLIDITGIEQLPAIQWKLNNLAKMDANKHRKAVEKLKCALDL